MLFQKKDIIYSETIGVCVVDDIVNLQITKSTPISIICCGLSQTERKRHTYLWKTIRYSSGI